MLIPGMNETMAQNILQSGFGSFQSVAKASAEEIMTIPAYDDPDKAQKLINDAQALINKYKEDGIAVPTSPQIQVAKEATSVKQRAEEQLKAELSKLKADEN